ncbi:MAG: hypothetical protein Q8S14_02045 [Algoriphagus sp.]|uniref:hypothetical protein n=1 Tax=Algoriphagus sp. TaxID=1872435 RepID=UPI002732285A|nr:hypothetical protein [Algoriphagus sp.]MDP2042119.1 hypothetical protein [Algoriphagus sp.]MDP3470627.1 hypothetical protein [Algoriphagus sp.]
MKNQIITYTAILFLLGFLGSCKVYRNVENLNPKSSEEERAGDFDVSSLNKLVEGDQIIIRTLEGKKYRLFYKRLHGNQLIGTTINKGLDQSQINQNIEFAIADIEQLWVKRVSAAATVPIVIVSSLGLAFGILVIALTSGGGFGW